MELQAEFSQFPPVQEAPPPPISTPPDPNIALRTSAQMFLQNDFVELGVSNFY